MRACGLKKEDKEYLLNERKVSKESLKMFFSFPDTKEEKARVFKILAIEGLTKGKELLHIPVHDIIGRKIDTNKTKIVPPNYIHLLPAFLN